MTWQSTPWADPLLFSTVVSATLAVFGLLYDRLVRHDRRVVAFATVMIGTAVWTLGYSFQFASATIADKRAWATVAMAGEAVVPVAWCTFALVYARREEWLTRARIGALWTMPALTVVLAVTNGSHGLVWHELAIAPAAAGGYAVLDATSGPWMFVHGAYSYLVTFAGVVLMIDLIARTRRVYRGQAAVLLAGIVVPAGANIASRTGVGPASTVDLTPPSMAILGIAFAVGIFKYRLFDLVPVARSAVVENMGEGYVLLDESNEVVDLNVAARSLLDGDEGRLLGWDARAAFDADLSVLDAFDGESITETITTGDPTQQRYIDLTVSRVEAGRVAGRLLVVRDVTDRIRIERRFRTLIEASSDMVFVLDETGRINYASPSVERVLGYDPDDLTEEAAFVELMVEDEATEGTDRDPEADAPSMAAATWRRVLDESGTDPESSDRIRFEVRLRTDDGETRTIEAIARYLVDDPAVSGIVINARDITERKQRELELERTNERLDQFASVVSHDLRNPLNVAMGHLDLAIETGDDGSLRTVRDQHDRMETMIEDLLTMARDGKQVEETEPIALDAAATRAWGNVETGGASLAVDTDVTVLAGESRLPNLLENLFRNAVEHGPGEGNPTSLTVRVKRVTGGFAVSDDGVGIPENIREKVTETGYTTEGDNTGYGLAIVDDIATAHGWDLAVTESPAGGTQFEFTGVEVRESAMAEVRANANGGDGPHPGG
ncbi:MAG: histidine kinase N-terminal 7TM domain-containing protein [Halobacteriales archaeon]